MDMSGNDTARFVYLGVILLAVVASVGAAYRQRARQGLRDLLIWIGIVLIIVAGYAYRSDFAAVGRRTLAALVPGMTVSTGEGEIAVVRSGDGHFHVDAVVNGAPMDLMVDTGASSVVLTYADARAAGITPGSQAFTATVSTANGVTSAAPVTLDTLTLGDIKLTRVVALVARPDALTTNLLGNSVLNRLSSFSVQGDRLTLKQ